MKYQFVRMQDDGRISSIAPHKLFNTVGDAKLMAPTLLAGRHGGGKIVLIQAIEVAICSADVRYESIK